MPRGSVFRARSWGLGDGHATICVDAETMRRAREREILTRKDKKQIRHSHARVGGAQLWILGDEGGAGHLTWSHASRCFGGERWHLRCCTPRYVFDTQQYQEHQRRSSLFSLSYVLVFLYSACSLPTSVGPSSNNTTKIILCVLRLAPVRPILSKHSTSLCAISSLVSE